MKKFWRLFILATAFITFFNVRTAIPADTSVASFNISGSVPVVFSITARGYPGDLDLNTGTKVVDRLIGLIHFRYNNTISSLKISSSTASGLPENSGNTAYGFPVGHEMMFKSTDCTVIDQAVLDGTQILTQAGVEVLDAGAPTMGEFDCSLTASWWGATAVQTGGKYAMTINVTMVSL